MARVPASQLRGMLVDDEGNVFHPAPGIFEAPSIKQFGADLMQKRRDKAIDDFWHPDHIDASGTRYRADGTPMGFLGPDRLPAGGGEWDAFDGIIAGQRNAAASQGRTMAVNGLASRPSMRPLASGTYASAPVADDDGWEPSEVRGARLRILQEQGNAMTDARLQHDRELDPGYQDYMRARGDERDVESAERRAPIYRQQRGMDREEDINDIRAGAFERGTNPLLTEERDYQRGFLEDRASMDALGRMFGSMRPETAELFESDPRLLDTMRGAMRGGAIPAPSPRVVPNAPRSGVAPPSTVPNATGAPGAPQALGSSADIPPQMRTEIEQWLRENRYAVNDKNLMAAYSRLQQ